MNEELFGKTKEEILTILGDPLQVTDDDSYEVLWFKSNISSLSTQLYFKNDQLMRISKGARSSKMTLQTIRENQGEGEETRKLHGDKHDSLDLYIHLWPDQLFAAVTEGNKNNSAVMNYYLFANRKEYNNFIGEKAERTSIAVIPGTSYVTTDNIRNNYLIMSIVVLFFAFLLILLVLWKIYLKNKKEVVISMEQQSLPENNLNDNQNFS